jgi:hypothetical protein
MPRLRVGQFSSQPGQHYRFGIWHGDAIIAASGAVGRLIEPLLTTAVQFSLRKQPAEFITNLTGQLLQIDERSGRC